jgi:hypothetical protein
MASKPNKKYIMGLNRKQGEEREENDFYATHPAAIPPLLKLLGWESGGKLIRENSCGQGHLSNALALYGHTVISTDLIDRGFGMTGVDFFEDHWTDNLPVDAVVMNPPYSHAMEFIEKSIRIAPIVCAFLRITFLETPDRAEFFKRSGLKYVAVFSKRMPSSKNAKFINADGTKESSSVCYAWFIWEKGFTGDPVVRWL